MVRKHYRHGIAWTIIGLACGASAQAAQWSSEAGVGVSTLYTDNVCLSADNEEEQWVGVVTPDIRVVGEGDRASLDLLAAVQANTLAKNNDCNDSGTDIGEKEAIAPRLRLSFRSELFEDWLYFDAAGFADQNSINPFAANGGGNLNGAGNTNTTYRYNLSPYISRRFADRGYADLRYNYSEVLNSEDFLRDSTADSVTLDVGITDVKQGFNYGVQADYNKISYEATGSQPAFDSELTSAKLNVGYRLNSNFALRASAGEEWNDFFTVFDEQEGSYWEAGLEWTPNKRIFLGLGAGDRFFGNTPSAEFTYNHRRSQVRLNYAKTLTYDRTLRSTDQFASDIPGFIEGTVPNDGEFLGEAGSPTTISTSPIIDERVTLVYAFNARRTSINVNFTHSDQSRLEDGRESTFINAGVGMRRDLSSKLALIGRINWADRSASEAGNELFNRDSDTLRLYLALERTFVKGTTVNLGYRISDRNSEFPEDEYTENRVTLSFRYQF